MTITLEIVKALRAKTGADFSSCKRALERREGLAEYAEEYLRKRGLAVAIRGPDGVALTGEAHTDALCHEWAAHKRGER